MLELAEALEQAGERTVGSAEDGVLRAQLIRSHGSTVDVCSTYESLFGAPGPPPEKMVSGSNHMVGALGSAP